jgi:uncharacterized protein YqgV (UPF0045/DUF77 family)
MQVAVDISLYPLDEDFIPPIKDVIERLKSHEGIEIETNRMSTQVRGDFAAVMPILSAEICTTFENIPHAVFTIKIINNPVN